MIKKIIYTSVLAASLTLSVVAGANEKILKKNDPAEIKDCHEGINRTIFALNKGLDNVIFEPVSKAYRVLPSPVRSGVSNAIVAPPTPFKSTRQSISFDLRKFSSPIPDLIKIVGEP